MDFVERYGSHLPKAPVIRDIVAGDSGYVDVIDTRGIGLAVVSLGGGRTRPQDDVDPAVGLSDLAPRGSYIAAGDMIARVHARDDAAADEASRAVLQSYFLSEVKPVTGDVVISQIDAG